MAYKTLNQLPDRTRGRLLEVERGFRTRYAVNRKPLEEGVCVRFIADRPQSLTFLGIDSGSIVYQTAMGTIRRPLKRASFGIRYDIYKTEVWTRNDIRELAKAGHISLNFDTAYCSSKHAVEVAIYDKWLRRWAHVSWESIGQNDGAVVLPEHTDRETGRIRITEAMAQLPISEPTEKTKLRLGMDEMAARSARVLKERTHLAPEVANVVCIFRGNIERRLADQKVHIDDDGERIRIRYLADGTLENREKRLDEGVRFPIGEDYTVNLNAYPLNRNDPVGANRINHIALCIVFDPENKVAGKYLFPCR